MSTVEKEQTPKDPKQKGEKPPFKEPQQAPPGETREMAEKPDHGEESYRGFGRLKGRKALITGGDSGIGRAVALAYAREGADVVISYLNEHEDAAETARLVKEAGRKVETIPGGIDDPDHCQKLVETTMASLGGIDILVNNAAMQRTHESIEEFTPEEWDATFRTNVGAMFYLSRAALPKMPPGSAIINTTSVQAYQPNPMLLAYAATKGAIVTFTKALAQLAIKSSVRVNAVAPGPVWTPLISSTMPIEKVEKFGQDSSLERPAQPAELAPLYVFLASDESRYFTGGIYDATGGRMLP